MVVLAAPTHKAPLTTYGRSAQKSHQVSSHLPLLFEVQQCPVDALLWHTTIMLAYAAPTNSFTYIPESIILVARCPSYCHVLSTA